MKPGQLFPLRSIDKVILNKITLKRKNAGRTVKWLAILCLAAVTLSGCGSPASSGSLPGQDGNTVTIVTSWDVQTVKDFQQLTAQFEASYPGIKLSIKTVSLPGLMNYLETSALSGTSPDLIYTNSSIISELAASGRIAPLPASQADEIGKDYGSGSTQSVTYRGAVYGYPEEASSYVLAVNKKMFAQAGISHPPADWQELTADARLLAHNSEESTQYGLGVVSDVDTAELESWIVHLMSASGRDFEAASTNGKSEDFQAERVLYQNLLSSGGLAPLPSEIANGDFGGYRNLTLLNSTGMLVMPGSWAASPSSLDGINWSNVQVVPLPGMADVSPSSPLETQDLAVNSQSLKQKEAEQVLVWLNSAEQPKQPTRFDKWLSEKGLVPGRLSDQSSVQAKVAARFLTGNTKEQLGKLSTSLGLK